MDDQLRKKTQETANKLFGKGIKMDPPYLTWREFDKDLASDFSVFITGKLYSRTVLTLEERQLVSCVSPVKAPRNRLEQTLVIPFVLP